MRKHNIVSLTETMSRLKQFTRSMMSSYAHLVVNVFYTLASVPLALKYLTKEEFGLWALTLQIANYMALVDLGMGSSIARILIDHKDERASGHYGGAIQSAILVGLAQAGIILVVGLSLLPMLAIWFRISFDLRHSFYWLMAGQVMLTAAVFSTRILAQILYAWQRIDLTNYAGIVQLATGLVALWTSFALGCGIFSLLIGTVIGWICGTVLTLWFCSALRLWPQKGEWGRASKEQFRELFNYGAEVFLIAIGAQLIISSQTLLVFRVLGAEAAALWSVMTKVFTLVTQIVWKIIGNAMPVFAEMQVRQEWNRFWERYRQLFVGANVFAGICAVIFAACNRLFIAVWTHGKFSWHPVNDVLLAAWMILLTQQCCHNSVIATLKQIKTLKYVYILEGIAFVFLTLFILPSTGITGMLVCSVAATALCTWLTGSWRIAALLDSGWKQLLWDWQKPLVRILLPMIPCWLAIHFASRNAGELVQLILNGCLLALIGAWVSVRFALPLDSVREITSKLPLAMQRPISFVIRVTCGQRAQA